MKEITFIRYESYDGCLFREWKDCMNYELNKLYEQSGVRFYENDEMMHDIDFTNDDVYDKEISRIEIDRNKKEENDKFLEEFHLNVGWCLVEDAIKGDGTQYDFIEGPDYGTIIKVK